MPSFDIVSNVDMHELANAVDQANREISSRFDFKDIDATYMLKDTTIILEAPDDFHVKQMKDILGGKMAKRGVDLRSLKYKEIDKNLSRAQQEVQVQQGLEQEQAKKVIKLIKNEKFKVQSAIQGEQIRVTGKKRDDLQTVITFLKNTDLDLPLQFENFRD
ncbi:MAG: YajQ family cyclic di-GMP-binding protein [Gammaproteobacteria bacterium]